MLRRQAHLQVAQANPKPKPAKKLAYLQTYPLQESSKTGRFTNINRKPEAGS